MARQGAKVIGLDASEENIKIAGNYAARQGVNIDFKCDLIENYSKTHKKKFDIITALEVIEHVDNVEVFLDNLDKCLKSGGFLFISTINRTLKSMALAKIAAEYLLRIVPIGTHDWNKFIKPEEITDHLAGKYELVNISGIILNPLTASWNISDRTSVNYIMTLKKK
jgi:2-polyprenyl-6-hydroxyphenyl methylase/3-demethylubiquinone-9 3-methyltransferase